MAFDFLIFYGTFYVDMQHKNTGLPTAFLKAHVNPYGPQNPYEFKIAIHFIRQLISFMFPYKKPQLYCERRLLSDLVSVMF